MIKKIFFRYASLLLSSVILASVFGTVSVFADTPRYSFSLVPGVESFYKVDPGDIIAGKLQLKLLDDIEADFKVVFVGGSINYVIKGIDESVFDLGNWVEFPEGDSFYIDGRDPGTQSVEVPFLIHVPEQVPPGDYLGIMRLNWVSTSEGVKGGSGVNLTTAIGVNLKFSVLGERVHKLEYVDLNFGGFIESLYKGDRKARLVVVHEARGNALMRPFVDIEVKDALGREIYTGDFPLGDIFPGSKLSKAVVMENMNQYLGWLDIKATLTYSLVGIDGSVGEEVFEVGTGYLRVYVIPWLQIFIVIGLLLLILFVLLFRRYRTESLHAISKLYTVKEGDTLQSICSKFRVDGKYVIRANKLKKPYFVNAGEKIFIPKKEK